MKQALRVVLQLALYAPLMAIIGYFSSQPQFAPIADDEALVRLSIVHAAERKEPCRERTPQELAKLAPNMRAALDCPRERSPLLVELELDGKVVFRREVQPSGLQRDGAAAVYQRLPVPAGTYVVVARLRDRAQGDFNYVRRESVVLAPGSALLVDFAAARGGFEFRS
jgi:hypothetical protein